MKKAVVLTLLCLLGFTCMPLGFVEPAEDIEKMQVNVFLQGFPNEFRLFTNIYIFKNIDSPIPNFVFPTEFLELEFELWESKDKFFVTFDLYFNQNITNETADYYANKIITEILRVFEYEDLNSIGSRIYEIKEEKKWIRESFGYLSLNTQTFSSFLKFVPKNGFMKFIDGIIDKYFIHRSTTTALYLSYQLKKRNSDVYCSIEICGVTSELLPSWKLTEFKKSVSVKELLNANTLLLVEQSTENQQIIIRVETNHTEILTNGLTTYIVDIKNIQPQGYTIGPCEWENNLEIRYYPLLPMEDIILELSISSFNGQNQTLPLTLIILSIFLAISLTVLLLRRKKLKRR